MGPGPATLRTRLRGSEPPPPPGVEHGGAKRPPPASEVPHEICVSRETLFLSLRGGVGSAARAAARLNPGVGGARAPDPRSEESGEPPPRPVRPRGAAHGVAENNVTTESLDHHHPNPCDILVSTVAGLTPPRPAAAAGSGGQTGRLSKLRLGQTARSELRFWLPRGKSQARAASVRAALPPPLQVQHTPPPPPYAPFRQSVSSSWRRSPPPRPARLS